MFADELSAAVDSGMDSINNIFGSKLCFNKKRRRGYSDVPHTRQAALVHTNQ